MAAVTQTTRLPMPGSAAVEAIRRAAAASKWKAVGEDPASGTLRFASNVSFFSWGENYVVQIVDAGANQTDMRIEATLKFGLADWGRRKRQIAQFLQNLGAPAPA